MNIVWCKCTDIYRTNKIIQAINCAYSATYIRQIQMTKILT